MTLYRIQEGTTIVFAPQLPGGSPDGEAEDETDDLQERVDELQERCDDLEERLAQSEESRDRLHEGLQSETAELAEWQTKAREAEAVARRLTRALEADVKQAPALVDLLTRYEQRLGDCFKGQGGALKRQHLDGVDTSRLVSQARAYLGEVAALKRRLYPDED